MNELTTTEQVELDKYEEIIERGLRTFAEVGAALLEIRDKRLYRVGYKTFDDYCHDKWGMERTYAYRLILGAQTIANLLPIGNIQLPATESQARPLTNLSAKEQPIAWMRALETLPPGEKMTAAHTQRAVDEYKESLIPTPKTIDGESSQVRYTAVTDFPQKTCIEQPTPPLPIWDNQPAEVDDEDWDDGEEALLSTPYDRRLTLVDGDGHEETIHVRSDERLEVVPAEEKQNSDEYYTPQYIIDAARDVLGDIDLDPASCALAQSIVQAEAYYNKAQNGLSKDWIGNIWLNPPFSDPKPFIMKMIAEYEAGNVTAAIVLTNNSTETSWGQALLSRFPVCFVGASNGRRSRISFWTETPDKPETSNRYSQMIFYIGEDSQKFLEVFSQFGPILEKK